MPAPPLFLPGLLCDASIWTEQARAFARLNAVVIDGYGTADRLEEMARIALAQAPPVFSLVGHSMGARVALEVLKLAPQRVERLALLDTGVHPPGPGEAEKRHALLALGREQGIDALIDAWLPPMVGPVARKDEAFMSRLREMIRSAGVELYAKQIHALLNRPDYRPMLSTINCPTLVGVGSLDEWSPVAQHEEIAALIPDAELVVFDNCGHMAPLEAPDQVNVALAGWLKRKAIELEDPLV